MYICILESITGSVPKIETKQKPLIYFLLVLHYKLWKDGSNELIALYFNTCNANYMNYERTA